jgi:hypothetical protein
VSFSVDQTGDYSFQLLVEGACKRLQCPVLSLHVDGETVESWRGPIYGLLRSRNVHLEPGEHLLRLETDSLFWGAFIRVGQQILLYRAGESDPLWIDLKRSRAWYNALLGGWAVSENCYQIGEAYAGGKPIFYTEVNTAYHEVLHPPYYSKTCYLREMLNTGCIYHFMLRGGVPLANYWLLFHDRAGIGVLEGVAYDGEAEESGRLDPHRTPVFHMLKAYRWNVFDWTISTEVLDSESFQVGPQTGITLGYAGQDFEISYLQVLATMTETEDKLSLFVINLHPEQDLPGARDVGRVREEGCGQGPDDLRGVAGCEQRARGLPRWGVRYHRADGASTRGQPVFVPVPETLCDGIDFFPDRRGRTTSSCPHRSRRECRGRTGLSFLGGKSGGRSAGVQRV